MTTLFNKTKSFIFITSTPNGKREGDGVTDYCIEPGHGIDIEVAGLGPVGITDTERLDWVVRNAITIANDGKHFYLKTAWETEKFNTPREAIDAAIKTENI